MKSKKLISLLCVASMTVGLLAGCGNDTTSTTTNNGNEGTKVENSASSGDGESSGTMTFEIFDVAANYQGVQTGWFAKVVKDRFDIELNIIAPQVAGDAIYQTRASTGNLGDILLLESGQFKDCVEAGLVKDISADIWNYSNISTFKDQISMLNNGLEGNDGKIYGIPTEMMDTSPTSD